MATASAKTGHFLAKVLGIKLDDPAEYHTDSITRGESVISNKTTDTFVEEEPRTWDWIREKVPNWRQGGPYLRSLFPFTYWIMRYNVQWLIGDLVAGMSINHSFSRSIFDILGQESQLVPSSYHRAWLMPSSPKCQFSSACTVRSWVWLCTGSLQHRRTSPLA